MTIRHRLVRLEQSAPSAPAKCWACSAADPIRGWRLACFDAVAPWCSVCRSHDYAKVRASILGRRGAR